MCHLRNFSVVTSFDSRTSDLESVAQGRVVQEMIHYPPLPPSLRRAITLERYRVKSPIVLLGVNLLIVL